MTRRLLPPAASLLVAVLVVGCAGPRPSAPVIDRLPAGGSAPVNDRLPAGSSATRPGPAKPVAAAPRSADMQEEGYTVKRGDTLYSIALDHGQDYREVAQWNNIDNPNMIRIDQVLRMRPPGEAAAPGGVQVRPMAGAGSVEARALGTPGSPPAQAAASAVPKPAAGVSAIKTEPRAVKLPYSDDNLALLSREPKPPVTGAAAPAVAAAALAKPASDPKSVAEAKPPAEPVKPPQQLTKPEADDGEVDWGWPTAGRVAAGFSESSNKGLDIAGKTGQPVLASASGTVLYVGTGIRGYGKLLVIRHNKAYSTVYAHNDSILVKEGQRVVKGQKVAEMGNTDADQVKLHFEIRRLGKPVDPAKFLPER